MKKINTLTFHNAINYGAVLQAYALVKKIGDLGYDNVFLYDYRNSHIAESYRYFKKTKSLKSMAVQFATLPLKCIKHHKFNKFIRNYIPLTKDVSQDDMFIVGSDQVWNYRASDFDKTFFLDFVNNKTNKFSYAASFGFSKIPENLEEEYKTLLEQFEMISVREKTGQKMIESLLNIDAPLVLDPVMLIDKGDWAEIAGHRNDKYILLYLMTKTPSIVEFAKKLSKKTGLKVYYINDYEISQDPDFVIKRTVGPKEWLNLFCGASYVVTNSFHGTAFSIVFNKNFFVELLPDTFDVNSRLTDVLNIFGLYERVINTRDDSYVFDDIDFDCVNEILKEQRELSEEYLNKILCEERTNK